MMWAYLWVFCFLMIFAAWTWFAIDTRGLTRPSQLWEWMQSKWNRSEKESYAKVDEYCRLLHEYGVDAEEPQRFFDAHKDDRKFRELAEPAKQIIKNTT